MKELEFIPDWYPALRRRRGLATAQVWASAVIMATMFGWGLAMAQQLHARQHVSSSLRSDLQVARKDLQLLEEELRLRKQLEQQGRVQARIGLSVELTRILAELDRLATDQVFLLELSADTQETVKPLDPNAASQTLKTASKSSVVEPLVPQVDRRLRVKLIGVAPTDVDVANFLSGLTSRPFFDEVSMTYARDRTSNGRVMREFELTFSINLNPPLAE